MLVVSSCLTLRAVPCVSDSGCEYTWTRTGLPRNCIIEREPSVSGQGMGCMLPLTTERLRRRGGGRPGQNYNHTIVVSCMALPVP